MEDGMGDPATIVTGTGGAIGGAVAERLRNDGHRVATLGHSAGADVVADFRDDTALERAVEAIGPLRALALCHGYLEPTPTPDLSVAGFRAMLDVNLVSVYTIIRTSLRALRDGASIVVVSSTAGFDHSPVGGPHYTVAKWGINGLVRHLADEQGDRAIRINAVSPGLIDNPMGHMFLTPEQYEADARALPLRRAGRDDEVASVVSFLLSDESSYITGAHIPVSGGLQ
jgi:NAD(P)-dependent dehydrogenase (short-subunit alcohol dehydrogenase family)